MGIIIKPKPGRGPVVPPPPDEPDVIFGAKLQVWFRAGDWTLAGSDIITLDNLEGTASRDGEARSDDPDTAPGSTPPQAITSDGVDAIEFQGGTTGGYFRFDGGLSGTGISAEVFLVHKAFADPQAIAADTGLWKIQDNAGANRAHYPFTDSNIYEAFGLAAADSRPNTGNPTQDLTVQHLYNVQSDVGGPSYKTYHNGNNLQYSDTIAYVREVDPLLNYWGRTHDGAGINMRWKGTGFELVFLNDVATNAERNDYLTYAAFQFPGLPALASF